MRHFSRAVAHNLYLHMPPAITHERLLHEHKARSALSDTPPEGVLYFVCGMYQADASAAATIKGFDNYGKALRLRKCLYVGGGCDMSPGCDGHTKGCCELP